MEGVKIDGAASCTNVWWGVGAKKTFFLKKIKRKNRDSIQGWSGKDCRSKGNYVFLKIFDYSKTRKKKPKDDLWNILPLLKEFCSDYLLVWIEVECLISQDVMCSMKSWHNTAMRIL